MTTAQTDELSDTTTRVPESLQRSSSDSADPDVEVPVAEASAPTTTAKEPNRGVIYISRVPPFMSVAKLRHYMSKFGDVGRIFLNPEDTASRKQRLRAGGSKKEMFTDGWAEFEKKSVAKLVALTLNNAAVGGPKRHNFWRDDLWNIRYLPKFKWHNLMEYLTRRQREREDRKRFELMQAKKENSFYLDQVARKRQRDRIVSEQELRKAKRAARSLAAEAS